MAIGCPGEWTDRQRGRSARWPSRCANPRELAARVAAAIETDEVLARCEVSGPGFLNITLTDAALLRQVAKRLKDERLGTQVTDAGTVTVVDYSDELISNHATLP